MVSFFLSRGSQPARLSVPDVNERRGDRQDETNYETAQEAAAAELVHVHTPRIWGARPRCRKARADDAASFRHHSGQSPLYPKVMDRRRAPGLSGPDRTGKTREFPCIVAPFEAKSAAVFAESALMGQVKESGDSRKRHRENGEHARELDEIAHVLTFLHRRLLYCGLGANRI
jgi:hypothetical protein